MILAWQQRITRSNDNNDRRQHCSIDIGGHHGADIRRPNSARLARHKGDHRNGCLDRSIGQNHIRVFRHGDVGIFASVGDIGAKRAIRNVERDADRPPFPTCLLPLGREGRIRARVTLSHSLSLKDAARS
jgi:hypothetical protein